MNRKALTSAIAGLGLALAASASQALVIGFSPPAQDKLPGETGTVNLVLSGLAADNQVVSGFDIDVIYTGSPTVVFLGGEYGAGLGVVDIDTISFAPTATGGVVELFNSSFLSDVDLDLLQGDSVVLATLRFRSNVPITSLLSVDFNPLTDIPGFQDPGTVDVFPTQLNPDPAGGSIRWIGDVTPPPTGTPLPGTLLLLAAPLGWLLTRRATRFA